MEFFTTSAGISVHVWDTKDERCPVKPGVTDVSGRPFSAVMPGSTGHLNDRASLPCVVLLHGYLETMYIFNELIEAMKPSYRLITIDLPGHGLTDSARPDAEGRRINSLSFCADVVAGVLDKCGVEKAYIAGHSLGGYIAQRFLGQYPDKALGIILLCSHPYPDSPDKAEDREREKKLIRAGKLIPLASASIPKMYFEDNLRACDEKIRETVELCETHDPEGICNSIDGLRLRPDLRPILESPAREVMLIHGDNDNFLPLERVEEMKRLFPKVRYTLIPSSGHNAFIEQQSAVIDAIDGFVLG